MSIIRKAPISVSQIPDFWSRVRHAKNRFLALDYDGTLAPFQIDRMKAFPLEGMVEILLKIRDSEGTCLAIISGRPVKQILKLMGDLKVIIIGCHGSELYYPEKSIQCSVMLKDNNPHTDQTNTRMIYPSDPEQEKRFKQAQQEAFELTGDYIRNRLERKTTSIAIHTRGMEPEKAEYIEKGILRLWSRDSIENGLQCRPFNGGIELRCIDINKGIAIKKLLEGEPKEAFCVYIGDDDTDEDAFKAIQKCGVGIKVGSPEHPTAAIGYLPDIQSVYHFLKEWANVTINKG